MSKGRHTGQSRGSVGPKPPVPPDPRRSTAEQRRTFLADRERQRRALSMWGRKVSYPEIARQLGCSAFTAWHLVKRALESLDAPEARARRAQENEALDEQERITWGIVARPGYRVSNSGRIVFEVVEGQDRPVPMPDQSIRLGALGHLLRIQERRSKLNGTDMPTKIDLSVNLEAAMAAVEVLEAEAAREEREIEARLALPPGEERAG